MRNISKSMSLKNIDEFKKRNISESISFRNIDGNMNFRKRPRRNL